MLFNRVVQVQDMYVCTVVGNTAGGGSNCYGASFVVASQLLTNACVANKVV